MKNSERKWELPLEEWDGLERADGAVFLSGGGKAAYDFPHTADMREYEQITFAVSGVWEKELGLEVALYPLGSGRPEFIRSTRACVWMAPGTKRVTVPFCMFDYSELVSAHMRYICGIEVSLKGGDSATKLAMTGICLERAGDFHVSVEGTASRAGEAGETVSYELLLENEREARRYVTVCRHRLGRESICFEYPERVLLLPGERKRVTVTAAIPENIPRGGCEKAILEWMADGQGEARRETVLYAARKREHPYLLHTEENWERLRKTLEEDGRVRAAWEKEYEETAKAWRVPSPHGGGYVYESPSQDGFLKTGIAWKLTGKPEYLRKVLDYMEGLLDPEKGYFSTGRSYFQFIESEEELARGSFPEHHACSAGWVQEAEFMIKLAFVYDLVYGEADRRMHEGLEGLMRSYMEFESWRVTDGDGNNFQLAEATAGLFFACILQDEPLTERFLSGVNGLYELMGAVLSDDGSYFEGATGYMRLAAEILLQDAVALENLGMDFKDKNVPASYDKYVVHAPWAVRGGEAGAEKPFLGMSFERWPCAGKPFRRLRDYMDMLRRMLNPQGILFSANDSNEQDFRLIMQQASYVYQDPYYLVGDGKEVNVLYGPHMLTERKTEEAVCVRNQGNGYAILREKRETLSQAVLKFGQHGGYHGHYDRLSLLSFLKDNRTFHNNEYAWYGYDSFLFKMWVQTSVAHNMTVVDGRMQKPSPCQCVYFAENEKAQDESETFSAVCAQTVTEWFDPPYGGQTPYLLRFPEEKCAREGRFILQPQKARGQGEIGEYSEPVFQRRLLILFHGYCIVWDYLEGQQEHRFDCFYHPMGRFDGRIFPEETAGARDVRAALEDGEPVADRSMGQRESGADNEAGWTYRERFSEDPFGAGQFIQNCRSMRAEGTLRLRFRDAAARVNGNDVVDNMPETTLWRAYPGSGEVTVGKYPQKGDSFTEENRRACRGYLEEPLKKTVSFSAEGKKAGFITLLEAGEETGLIKTVECQDFDAVLITEKDEKQWRIAVEGMGEKEAAVRVAVTRRG